MAMREARVADAVLRNSAVLPILRSRRAEFAKCASPPVFCMKLGIQVGATATARKPAEERGEPAGEVSAELEAHRAEDVGD